MDVKRTRHAAYNINYHFVWIAKYRRQVLTGKIPFRLSELLEEKTIELEGEILNLTVQADHVHMFGSFPPPLAPHQIMHRLKGYTAFMLRKEFPHLKSRLPNMWTRSVTATPIQRYLDEQKRS
jgi:putative transposase